MHIKLAYGGEQVPIDVPDNWINGRCYRPHPVTACADARAELISVISGLPTEHSLPHLADGRGHCVIAVDSENPVICQEILPALIELIEDETLITAADIHIIIANRVWNALTEKTISDVVPDEILDHYKVTLHDPFDSENIVSLGESSKRIPLTVNKLYKKADFKIVLGGVRPDILAGFSGGRSIITPGLAGKETLKALYNYGIVTDRNTRYGNFRDNPFHITGVEAANLAGCDLCINVGLTMDGKVHHITAGHFGQSHLASMNKLRELMVVKVKEPMDIVVTSGGGSPYDDTLTRLVSTISAVEPVLKPDGTIVIAAALKDGLGPPDLARLFNNANSLQETLMKLSGQTAFIPGQWIVQRFYTILQSHEVILFNKSMDEDLLWSTGLTPAGDITEAVHEAMQSHGQRCKIVALPDGPFGIGEISK